MSHDALTVRAEFPCPHCRAAVSGRVRLVADVAAEPELAAVAREGALNRVTCPSCGGSFMAPAPLLYHHAARALAVAYVPPGAGDAQSVAGALVARYLAVIGADDVEDYLLEPRVVDGPGALRRAIVESDAAGAAGDEADAVHARAAHFAEQRGHPEVAQVIELLAGVSDEAAFLTTVNAHPDLLEPGRVRAVRMLGEEASERGDEAAAEALLDLAGLLTASTPPEAAAESEMDDDERLTPEVRDLLVAGDMALAEEYLEPPDPRRAMQVVDLEDAERREGFAEHALLFGRMVHEMMEPATPDHLPDEMDLAPASRPVGVPEESFDALVAANGPDMADEVIDAHPELLGRATLSALASAAAEALNVGDDGAAAHYVMLADAVRLAGADILEEEEGL